MPSAFGAIDSGMPDLSGAGSTEDKLRAIQDYLYQLLEQLRYTLNNISPDNFNETEVGGWAGETIVKPIHAEIESVEEGLSTQIDVTAGAITSEVTRATEAEGTLGSRITQTADAITSEVTRATTAEGTLSSRITQNADAIYGEVIRAETEERELRGSISITADAITAEVQRASAAEGALGSRITQTADAITAEVTRAGTAESRIEQKADDIQLQVTGASANEWISGISYAKDTYVKVTTAAAGGTAQSITYYKCTQTHSSTSSSPKKPGTTAGADYWGATDPPNVNSMIDLSLDGLTLAYDSGLIGYSEWTVGTVYEKDAVVSVTTNGVAAFYKAKNTHTATVNNKPPYSARWESTTEPTEHNGAFIKLMKDGTYIGGGKVFVKDLDASTITTGTLNAKNIILLDSFSVHVIDNDGQEQNCGSIGGDYASTIDESAIEINSSNSKQYVRITDGYITIISGDRSGNESFHTWISLEPDHVEIGAYDYPGGGAPEISKTLIIDKDGIYIRDGFAGRKHDLFDLF